MSNIAEQFQVMHSLIETSNIELHKLQNKKIKTSAGKIRANLLTIKKLCDTTRKQVLEEMKAIPTKTRTKTPPNTPEPVEEKTELTEREVMEELGEIEKPKKRVRKDKK